MLGSYQDVATRWNSEFLMLERPYAIKKSINAELAANPCSKKIGAWQRATLYSYSHSIKQTKGICLDTTPSLSMVLPIVFGLKQINNKFIREKQGSAGVTFARNVQKVLNGATRFPKT
ncbi:hypothetical protein PR048_017498 [Dryococelus australis]|uniref:Uncharacterized protein n=1 Tax=Dryococelus australis TaxID=614101 RepID=A0ABQ9H9N6_9NEOP|nr:hypothetical protein PR048_017498 [Dryococelus australis]